MTTLLPLASITEPLVNFATNVVSDLGLPGIFVLMFFESACIPIPSEATMLFAGFNVANGDYSLLAVTLTGALANLAGSWLAYAVGYYGRLELIERHGEATVFFTRMLPIIRTFISLPAGVARMPFWRFSLFTFLGCLPWVFALAFIGKQAGDNWTKWKDSLHYVDYAVAVLIVVGIAYLVIRRRRDRDAGGAEAEPAADAGQG